VSNNKPIVEPLPAASVLLVRDGDDGLEVLMMERAKTMKFAPGAFVFPGGKVDRDDGDHSNWNELVQVGKSLPDLAFRIAALRELYEEASVLLASDVGPDISYDMPFSEQLRQKDVWLNVNEMVPFAHWVTPEPMPRRFDTHFYLAAHNGQTAVHDGNEAISLRWINPHAILTDWDHDEVPLMFPTRLNLMKLARATSVAEALEQARNTQVVRTLPVVGRDEKGIKLTIDPACGYEVTRASAKELKVETPK